MLSRGTEKTAFYPARAVTAGECTMNARLTIARFSRVLLFSILFHMSAALTSAADNDPPPFSVGQARKICTPLKEEGRSDRFFGVAEAILLELSPVDSMPKSPKSGDQTGDDAAPPRVRPRSCEWCKGFFKSIMVACKPKRPPSKRSKKQPVKEDLDITPTPTVVPLVKGGGVIVTPSLKVVHAISSSMAELAASSVVSPKLLVAAAEEDDVHEADDAEHAPPLDVVALSIAKLTDSLRAARGFTPAEQEYFRIAAGYFATPFDKRIQELHQRSRPRRNESLH